MKLHTLYIISIILCCSLTANAQNKELQAAQENMPYYMEIKDATIQNMNGAVAVRILFVAKQNVPSNHSVILVPELVDTIKNIRAELPNIYLNSRKQQIYYGRNKKALPNDAVSLRKKKNQDLTVDYLKSIPYQTWMDKSVLMLKTKDCGCNISRDKGQEFICKFKEEEVPVVIDLFPTYRVPKAEAVKIRAEKGSAYLCFVVDKTDIRPDYMSNPQELAKIRNSIDLVKNDPNVEIQSMSISGYASPEGKLSHNIELSQKRTESLKNRIISSGIIKGVNIKAESKGENWIGFLEYLNKNQNIPQQTTLLSILHSNIDLDEKERQMRKEALDGWKYCLRNCFPQLRRTDYSISYIVRPFTLEESEEIFRTKPMNLSLNEIYRLADKYKDNEAKYREIMQKTYALYPDDEAANLTMAYLALKYKDTESAEKYLKKVMACPEKTLNEGIIAYLKGDIPMAKALVEKAAESGLKDAQKQLEEFKKLK